MWVKINRGSSSFLLTNRRKEVVTVDFVTASSLNDFYFRFSPRVKTAIQPRPV
jgi:crotonobetainyl-CoA:carnitine CoA-transferase CaiB-like acyl-CoA transferase